MTEGDRYRRKVIELCELGKNELSEPCRTALLELAFAYLRLADLVDHEFREAHLGTSTKKRELH